MADIEKENDYESAIELAHDALETARDLMESYSPELAVNVASPGLQQGADGTSMSQSPTLERYWPKM